MLAKATRIYETDRDLLTTVENHWRPEGSNDLISGYAYVSDELARRSSVVNTGVAFAADRLSALARKFGDVFRSRSQAATFSCGSLLPGSLDSIRSRSSLVNFHSKGRAYSS